MIWLQTRTVFWQKWSNHLHQLFNVHGASDVRQTYIHTTEPLVLSLVPLRLRWLLTSKKDINQQVLIKSQQK